MKRNFFVIIFAFFAILALVAFTNVERPKANISFTIDNDTNQPFDYCSSAYSSGTISKNSTRTLSYDEGTSFYYCAGGNKRELFKVSKSIEGRSLRVSNLLR